MKIVSAGIRYTLRNGASNRITERVVMCTRYDDAFVKRALKEIRNNRLFVYCEERGFIASTGCFVLPVEAKEIATKAGQVETEKGFLEVGDLY